MSSCSLACLVARKPIARRRPERCQPGDDQPMLDVAARPRVLLPGGDDAELAKHLLQFATEALAVGGVVNAEAIVGHPWAAVALEAGHQERPLHTPSTSPDSLGDELVSRTRNRSIRPTDPRGKQPGSGCRARRSACGRLAFAGCTRNEGLRPERRTRTRRRRRTTDPYC